MEHNIRKKKTFLHRTNLNSDRTSNDTNVLFESLHLWLADFYQDPLRRFRIKKGDRAMSTIPRKTLNQLSPVFLKVFDCG
jgi:hypothetical protein